MKIEVFWWAGQVEDVGARAEKQQVKIMQSGPRLWRVMEAALEIAPKQLRSSWQVEIKSKVRPMAYYGRLLLQAECCVLDDEIIAVQGPLAENNVLAEPRFHSPLFDSNMLITSESSQGSKLKVPVANVSDRVEGLSGAVQEIRILAGPSALSR